MKPVFSHCGQGKPVRIGAFDTETAGLGGGLLLATACSEEKPEPVVFSGSGEKIISDLLTYMAAYPHVTWYAHNAQYDWRYFLNALRAMPNVRYFLRNDNSIFQIIANGVTMRDSFAMWPKSLAALAEKFCPKFPKKEIEIAHFNPDNSKHIEYAKRDVEILRVGLRRFFDLIMQEYDVNIAGTIASTALRAWEHMLPKNEVYGQSKTHEDFFRRAYFGGLVFLTTSREIAPAYTFDINSSYPFQMRKHGVPYGTVMQSKKYPSEYPGFFDVTVTAPEDLIVPILPYRNERGFSRFPSGTFRTCVSSIELDFALTHGYVLHEIHDGRIFPDGLIYPFENFVAHAEEVRRRAKGTALEQAIKLIQNSLYGKFGARRERRKLFSASEARDEELLGCEPWDEEGDYYIRTEFADDMRCNVHWAAWITANARLYLLENAYRVGIDHVIYGDTDSITLDAPLIEPGLAYGDFKLEKKWKRFSALAPKVYSGRKWNAKTQDYEWGGACKGLPGKATNWQELFEAGKTAATYDSIPSLMVALKGTAAARRTVTRKSTDIANSLNWEKIGQDIRPREIA